MFREILGVAEEPPARRRWFHDDYFDLFIWQTKGEVTLFQLCYGIGTGERALVWEKGLGFFHDGVRHGGAGDVLGAKLSHGVAPGDDPVIARFSAVAPTLPTEIHSAVRARIDEYCEKRLSVPSRRRRFRRADWQR
jgi:hypothetical protein